MDIDVDLFESLNRLHRLRLAALTGRRFDPDEFDQALIDFRRAWNRARQGSGGPQRVA